MLSTDPPALCSISLRAGSEHQHEIPTGRTVTTGTRGLRRWQLWRIGWHDDCAHPALPAGLTLNATTGQISGTPGAATPSATYTITAQNAGGTTTFVLTLAVNPATTAALEPGAATTIGTGQSINLFFVQRVGGAPYPSYVDATQVSWSSSHRCRAVVNANGVVTGLAEGTTTITALFQTFSLQLTVQVNGAWIARTLPVPAREVCR